MRWSCPHCGTNLGVTDERLGTGWSFSRCFKCAGYALIRRAEVNVIKVHGAPSGERVLSTEVHEQTLMSQKTIDALIDAPAGASQAGKPSWIAQNASFATPPPLMATPRIPESLPELSETAKLNFILPKISVAVKSRLLPAAIVIAGVTTVSSGLYFYLQGRELLNRASAPAQSARPVQNTIQPATVIQQPQPAAHAPGVNRDRAVEAAAASISDQLRERAMAPTREPQLTDAAPTITNMLVQTAISNAKVRSGPGIEHELVGIADPETRYVITAWQDRWFKIQPKANAAAAVAPPQIEGWIRNDLVRIIGTE
jgi:hypothetical protein